MILHVAVSQDWLKKLGKDQKRKGKRLFMPARICLTVCTALRLASLAMAVLMLPL